MTKMSALACQFAGLVLLLLCFPGVSPADAQYAETPRVLATVKQVNDAVQIGHRLFVSGFIEDVGPPASGAVAVDAGGRFLPDHFPYIDGTVNEIVADGLGGWVVAGAFRQVDEERFENLVRIRPDGTADPRYRVSANGPIRKIAIAHGRAYIAGDFTEVNGSRRLGLAALDVATGAVSSWGSTFDPGLDSFTKLPRRLRNLAVSAIGVYVSGGGDGNSFPASAAAGRLWGFDAGTGSMLFEKAAFVTAIAATTRRVYVGGYREPPLRAIDPLTGADLPWSPGLVFRNIGSQEIRVTALLVDGSRLYAGGYFQTTDGQQQLVAVDAETGQPSAWRPSPSPVLSEVAVLQRLGPGLVALQPGEFSAYDVVTGARLPWTPQTHGQIATVAAAPWGAVLGGSRFHEAVGVPRNSIVSFDLDTGELEPWTTALPPDTLLERLETDGTLLFGATNGGVFFKIDPDSGAVLGTLDSGGAFLVSERLAGDRLVAALGGSLGIITIADWSQQTVPLVISGVPASVGSGVQDLEVAGNTAYVAGAFTGVNGVNRSFLAAIDLDTGAVLPFDALPDAQVDSVRVVNGRLWVAGRFHRIGGALRRGLAELDPATGAALAWNPDAPGGARLDADPAGTLYVEAATTIGGRDRGKLAAFSTATEEWLPWRPSLGNAPLFVAGTPVQRKPALLAGCFVPTSVDTIACYPQALPSPTAPAIQQSGSQVTLSWTLPAGPQVWTGLRVDVGTREGTSDVASVTVPADATSLSSSLPAGAYFVRVRTTGPDSSGLPTRDLSFAVGPPDVPAAPLDPTAVAEGSLVRFDWHAPSTGAPAAYRLDAEIAGTSIGAAALPVGGGTTSLTIDAPPGRYWARLTALNQSGASASSSELAIDVGSISPPCYATPPMAPSNLTASIAGAAVTLTWQQPDNGPIATRQGIVAGTAPGLNNLGVFVVSGSATSHTMTVPPGSYYARVVAQNDCGLSGSSNEVQVVVGQ
jgi:hypothetical protein